MPWWMKLLDFFGLNPHREAVRNALQSAMRKGERLGCEQCARNLDVQQEEIERLHARSIPRILKALLREALQRGRLDDNEVAALRHLYGLYSTPMPPREAHQVTTANTLWRAETLPLPTREAPFILKRGERCYFIGDVEASEIRTQTVRTGYSGTSTSVRLAKGVYLRSGSYRSHSYKRDVRHSFGRGTMAITNQRTIISLPNKNITIKHDALINVDYGISSIQFHKGSGKPLMVQFTHNPALSVILSRCIDQDFGDHRPAIAAKVATQRQLL